MRPLGFLGTGAITSAIVTGLRSTSAGYSIRLSPRNREVAADLARRFPKVSVACSNQEVLDESEILVIAVRPQIAESVLSELRFRSDHNVISLVSGLSVARIAGLVAPARRITRAVPLPSAARRRCPTGIYPPDPAAAELFALLGAVYQVESENEFSAICTTTAIMAAYFAFADRAASWLVQHGVPQAKAREYIGRMYFGMAETAVERPEESFQVLAKEHATRGGTNEQVLAHLTSTGVFESYSEALDGVMRRVTASK
jgi:pyrroline-5-carboxylate reductase